MPVLFGKNYAFFMFGKNYAFFIEGTNYAFLQLQLCIFIWYKKNLNILTLQRQSTTRRTSGLQDTDVFYNFGVY